MSKDKDQLQIEDENDKDNSGGASTTAVKPDKEKGKDVAKERKATSAQSTRVSVTYLRPARLKISGDLTPSGEAYDFGPGQTIAVNPADVEFLRSKNRSVSNKEACCGAGKNMQVKYFEIDE